MSLLLVFVLLMLLLSSSLTAAASVNDNPVNEKVTLTYYGQSAFMLSHGNTRLIFDPYLSKSPWKAANADEIECQYILVSHGHQDHLGDTVPIAKRTGAKVITFNALTGLLKEQGCDVAPMDIGGQRVFDFGYVKLTRLFMVPVSPEDWPLGSLLISTGNPSILPVIPPYSVTWPSSPRLKSIMRCCQ
jgi:L-ascorbate metabolism protein UlaG (beta-lactamase superfamily)